MKRVKISHDDSHISENLKSPNSDDKRIRLERRWRRREARNDSLKHNDVTSATRPATKVCRNSPVSIDKNDHPIDDEIDEDWAKYLATYTGDDDDDEVDSDYAAFLATNNPDIEAGSSSNWSGDSDEVDSDYAAFLATHNTDIDADSSSNWSGESDEVDSDYAAFLATHNPDIEADSSSNWSSESDEVDSDYAAFLATHNPDIEADSSSNWSGDSDKVDSDYAAFLATHNPDIEADNASNHSGGSNFDTNVGNNNVIEEMEESDSSFSDQSDSDYIGNGVGVDEDDQLPRKRSSVRRSSQVSDTAFVTPKVQCDDIDIDYEAFLNSVTIVDDDEEYMRVKNPIPTNTSNVDGRSTSSDSDIIIMDSIPIGENTPFVSSKVYDLSCFVEEMNLGDSRQISACYDSEFRRRLVECLDKPYDQKEYDKLLLNANKQNLKERHVETRQGVVKQYHSKGVNKSFLELYPDVNKAIARESAEKRRVLFLLRGFFFWLQNVSDEQGRFKPWLDESCLEKLRNM